MIPAFLPLSSQASPVRPHRGHHRPGALLTGRGRRLGLLFGVIATLGATILGCALEPAEGPAASRALPSAGAAEGGPTPDWACKGCNLVLISVDTLRADHLGAYGYARETSPHIDAFAAESVLFERAYSTAFHTAESHMSIFTGLFPSVHRVRNAGSDQHLQHFRLSPQIKTLAEIFQASGYRTASFNGGGNLASRYGFARGFEVHEYVETVEPVVRWLDQNAGDQPFFLFFHTYRVHDPYLPSPPYDSLFDEDYDGDVIGTQAELDALVGDGDFAELRRIYWDRVDPQSPADIAHLEALYDGEIVEVDQEVGQLLSTLDRLAPETVVIFLSDHGEEFQEHGRFLHGQFYEELLHVPLMIRSPVLPEAAGSRVPQVVSLVGLAPTVVDLLDLRPPGFDPARQFQATSLVPWILGRGEEGGASSQRAYAEKLIGDAENFQSPRPLRHMTLIDGAFEDGEPSDWVKLIRKGEDQLELYDLEGDPTESRNLVGEGLEAERELMRELRRWARENNDRRSEIGAVSSGELDEETLEQLRALGYIDG